MTHGEVDVGAAFAVAADSGRREDLLVVSVEYVIARNAARLSEIETKRTIKHIRELTLVKWYKSAIYLLPPVADYTSGHSQKLIIKPVYIEGRNSIRPGNIACESK